MAEPRTIDRYVVGERIAVGGMAEIFAARLVDATGDAWPLVLKVTLPQPDGEGDVARLLADEARLAVGLDHPNLVRVVGFGEAGAETYIVMERVQGVTLAQLLRRQERLPVGVALVIAEGLLRALEYIHGRVDERGNSLHIVHRDVTPSNVLLSDAGAVKLGDFGIARSRLQRARTRTGVIKGTVQYMAPEQVTGSGVDARTDLYGVGLILYEMLTGHRVIEAEREVELLKLAEAPPWIPPSTLVHGLDARVDRALRPALRRFPEERYATARAFLAALERLGRDLGVAQASPDELGRLVAKSAVAAGETSGGDAAVAAEPTVSGGQSANVGGSTVRARARLAGPGVAVLVAAAIGIIAWLSMRSAFDPTLADAPSGVRSDAMTGYAEGAKRDAAPAAARRGDEDRGVSTGRADAPVGAADGRAVGASRDRTVPPHKRSPVRPTRRDARPRGDASIQSARKPPAEAVASCKRRLAAARASLVARGILDDDLPRSLLQLRREVARSCSDSPTPELLAARDQLERELAGIKVDREFIRAKLQRVDARLRALPRHRPDREKLQEEAGMALQALLDGEYAAANARLNRILSSL